MKERKGKQVVVITLTSDVGGFGVDVEIEGFPPVTQKTPMCAAVAVASDLVRYMAAKRDAARAKGVKP